MQFRELARARDECVGSGACNTSAPAMRDFDRLLVKIPEHTWGLAQAYFTVRHSRAVCCLATVSPDFDLGAVAAGLDGCELPHFSSFPLSLSVSPEGLPELHEPAVPGGARGQPRRRPACRPDQHQPRRCQVAGRLLHHHPGVGGAALLHHQRDRRHCQCRGRRRRRHRRSHRSRCRRRGHWRG